MDPANPAYHIDWNCSPICREHAAQNREWFTSYTPFTSEVETILGKCLPVSGIGTVCLPLKTRRPDAHEGKNSVPTKKQKKDKMMRESTEAPPLVPPTQPEASSSSKTESLNSHNLVLHDVLHVPGLSYNILSMHKIDASQQYTIEWVGYTAIIKDKGTGSPLAFTEPTPFTPKFPLVGQEVGVSSATAKTKTEVFEWSPREKQRWEETHDDSKWYDAAAERAAEKEEAKKFRRMLDAAGWSGDDDDPYSYGF